MSHEVAVIESTLRDGQQSLWATRMTTAMMLPVLPVLDSMGFHTIEYMGTAVMDACVRYLQENPWERMRLVRERVEHTPLGMISPCLGFSVGRGALPDDISALLFERCAANGIRHFFLNDGLNDIRNYEVPVRAVHAAGGTVLGTLTFSISPVHTDEYYAARVQDLVTVGADIIVLKDPNGILTPDRVHTLVPALVARAGKRPVFCHSHCVTGLGPATNLAAVQQGAVGIWTCAGPLANGSSLPATRSMVRHLRRLGYRVNVSEAGIPAVEAHFRGVAERYRKPLGRPAEYDPAWYDHQMPGGMISNFRAQLAQIGLADRLDAVLDAIPAVRADLGWCPMVTPFSQMVATQAALNLLYGPYAVVLHEVERLVLGHYGRTPAPIAAHVVERAGKGREPITARPGAVIPPDLERFQREHGPFATDEELLLAYLFMPEQLRVLAAAGPIPRTDEAVRSPLVDLVRDVARRPEVKALHLVLGG